MICDLLTFAIGGYIVMVIGYQSLRFIVWVVSNGRLK